MRLRLLFSILVFTLFSLSLSAIAGEDWLSPEDKADKLEGSDLIKAYQTLRQDLIAGEGAASDESGYRHMVLQQERIDAKLALAIRMRSTPNANARERRGMAREAARIGMMYVKEGSPERAVGYERFIEGIEASSPAINQLRNATRSWFREVLVKDIADRDWKAAREHIQRWSNLLGADPSVEQGKREYAEVRQREIVKELQPRNVGKAMELIGDEKKIFPGQPAWEKALNSIRSVLMEDVSSSHKDLKVDKMRDSINRLKEFFPEEEKLSTLEADLVELDYRLQPLPVARKFGMVRSPFIRINAETYLGPSTFAAGGSESSLDFEIAFILYAEMRWLKENIKTHQDRPLYLGTAISSIFIDAITDDVTATAKITHPELLFGRRGDRYSIHMGLGPVFNSFQYKDDVAVVEYDGLKLNFLALSLAGEFAFTENITVYGRSAFSSGEPLRHFWSRFGLRYYLTPNSSLSVGGNIFSSTTTSEEFDTEVKIDANGFTVGAIVQF